NEMVQTLRSRRSHPSLSDGIGSRRSERHANLPYPECPHATIEAWRKNMIGDWPPGSHGRSPSVGALPRRRSVPPHAGYLCKHARVQDAAYGTLLREPRRALHARIAETIERQFADIARNQPDLLARHCAEGRTDRESNKPLWQSGSTIPG